MCMPSNNIAPPPPPPAAPPVLEQAAPKTAGGENVQTRKRKGLSAYKIDTASTGGRMQTPIGGIPMKTGVGPV